MPAAPFALLGLRALQARATALAARCTRNSAIPRRSHRRLIGERPAQLPQAPHQAHVPCRGPGQVGQPGPRLIKANMLRIVHCLFHLSLQEIGAVAAAAVAIASISPLLLPLLLLQSPRIIRRYATAKGSLLNTASALALAIARLRSPRILAALLFGFDELYQ